MIKAQDKTEEEKKKAERRQNPKYHKGRGTCLKRYVPEEVRRWLDRRR